MVPDNEVPVWERTTPTPTSTPTKRQIDQDAQIAASLQNDEGAEADAADVALATSPWQGDGETVDPAGAPADAEHLALAREISEQDAQAMDILSQLPSRDSWHGAEESVESVNAASGAWAASADPDTAEAVAAAADAGADATPAVPGAAGGGAVAKDAAAVASAVPTRLVPRPGVKADRPLPAVLPTPPRPLGVQRMAAGINAIAAANPSAGSRSMACARQGAGHIQRGELEAARKCFQRGVDVGDATEPLLVKLHAYLGELYRGERKYALAISNGNAHLTLARKLQNSDEVHRALRTLGVTHMAAGLRQLAVPDEEGDLENSRMEESSNSLSKSLEFFEELVKDSKDRNEVMTTAQAYRDVMKVHQVLRNDLQALEAAEQHLVLIRGRGSKRDIGRAVSSCAMLRAQNGINGDIDWTKKAFVEVLELLWEQAAIGESIPDAALVGNAYYQISKLLEDAGSWADWYGPAKARQFLQKAIDNFAMVKSPNARVLAQKGECEKRLEALNDDSGCVVQ